MTIKNDLRYLKADEQFSTFDLGLASALLSLGYELETMDKTNPRKIKFIFKYRTGLGKTISNYWNDCLKVNARTLFNDQKMLKNRIYSE